MTIKTIAATSAAIAIASTGLFATPAHASNPSAPSRPAACTTPIDVLWATGVDGPRPVEQRTGASTTKSLVTSGFHATARGLRAVSPESPKAYAAATIVVEGVPGLKRPTWVKDGSQWVLRVGSGSGVTTAYRDVANAVRARYGGTCMATRTSMTVSGPALAYGAKYVGLPYVWGGTSLTKGADCSGFVQAVIKNPTGKKLPRTSSQQRAATTRISAKQARPGDLVFFARHGRVHHVGIYAGNGYVLNAPRTGTVVRYDRIATNFPGDTVSYGRVR